MANVQRLSLSRHPILRAIYNTIQTIERCGASPELTGAVILAAELSEQAAAILDERDTLRGALQRIAIYDDADCGRANDPRWMRETARDALRSTGGCSMTLPDCMMGPSEPCVELLTAKARIAELEHYIANAGPERERRERRKRRDKFARAVLTGLFSDSNYDAKPEKYAELAARMADAAIAELDRTERTA